MEHDETRPVTLQVARSVLEDPEFQNWEDLGVVLQAYLRDSLEDARELRDWASSRDVRLWVRLVRGAYWDFERIHAYQRNWSIPVYEKKGMTDRNYERMIQVLCDATPHLKPAFASHNLRSLALGICSAEYHGLSDHNWECQMLYGMGERIQKGLLEKNVPLRVYVPYG
ncbi:MAG: proline dehydrogenase family protein, partial [bacterium]